MLIVVFFQKVTQISITFFNSKILHQNYLEPLPLSPRTEGERFAQLNQLCIPIPSQVLPFSHQKASPMQGFRVPRECFGVLNNVLCTAAAIAEWSVCVSWSFLQLVCVVYLHTLLTGEPWHRTRYGVGRDEDLWRRHDNWLDEGSQISDVAPGMPRWITLRVWRGTMLVVVWWSTRIVWFVIGRVSEFPWTRDTWVFPRKFKNSVKSREVLFHNLFMKAT